MLFSWICVDFERILNIIVIVGTQLEYKPHFGLHSRCTLLVTYSGKAVATSLTKKVNHIFETR